MIPMQQYSLYLGKIVCMITMVRSVEILPKEFSQESFGPSDRIKCGMTS
jgi:hypothetical protein